MMNDLAEPQPDPARANSPNLSVYQCVNNLGQKTQWPNPGLVEFLGELGESSAFSAFKDFLPQSSRRKSAEIAK
jgi:hypothetical protein